MSLMLKSIKHHSLNISTAFTTISWLKNTLPDRGWLRNPASPWMVAETPNKSWDVSHLSTGASDFASPCSMFDGCHHCHRWFATWHLRQRSSSEFPPSSVRSPRRALQPTAPAALQPQRESSRWKGQQKFEANIPNKVGN